MAQRAKLINSRHLKEFNYKIGKLTEYFKFDDVELVLQDLHQMKPKVLEQVELDILFGKSELPTSFLIQLYLI